jgi:hypothetical protein
VKCFCSSMSIGTRPALQCVRGHHLVGAGGEVDEVASEDEKQTVLRNLPEVHLSATSTERIIG